MIRVHALRYPGAEADILADFQVMTPGGPVTMRGEPALPGGGLSRDQMLELSRRMSRLYATLTPAQRAYWDREHAKEKALKKARDRARWRKFLGGAAGVLAGTAAVFFVPTIGPAIVSGGKAAGAALKIVPLASSQVAKLGKQVLPKLTDRIADQIAQGLAVPIDFGAPTAALNGNGAEASGVTIDNAAALLAARTTPARALGETFPAWAPLALVAGVALVAFSGRRRRV